MQLLVPFILQNFTKILTGLKEDLQEIPKEDRVV